MGNFPRSKVGGVLLASRAQLLFFSSGLSLLIFADVLYAAVEVRLFGSNLYSVLGLALLTVGVMADLGREKLDRVEKILLLVLLSILVVVTVTRAVALGLPPGVQSYVWGVVFVLYMSVRLPNQPLVRRYLRQYLTGLGFVLGIVQILNHVFFTWAIDLSGSGFVLIEGTRQMLFHPGAAGTLIVVSMTLTVAGFRELDRPGPRIWSVGSFFLLSYAVAIGGSRLPSVMVFALSFFLVKEVWSRTHFRLVALLGVPWVVAVFSGFQPFSLSFSSFDASPIGRVLATPSEALGGSLILDSTRYREFSEAVPSLQSAEEVLEFVLATRSRLEITHCGLVY